MKKKPTGITLAVLTAVGTGRWKEVEGEVDAATARLRKSSRTAVG